MFLLGVNKPLVLESANEDQVIFLSWEETVVFTKRRFLFVVLEYPYTYNTY